jgi:hypothetical protein
MHEQLLENTKSLIARMDAAEKHLAEKKKPK